MEEREEGIQTVSVRIRFRVVLGRFNGSATHRSLFSITPTGSDALQFKKFRYYKSLLFKIANKIANITEDKFLTIYSVNTNYKTLYKINNAPRQN